MLIGLDACKDPVKVFKAYNDSQGITRKFYLNGLSHANSILGFEAFKLEDWDVIGTYNEASGCHQAYYSPRKDISLDGLLLKRGEKVLFEKAFKYGSEESETLWRSAGLIPTSSFGNTLGDYCKNRCRF
jgi:uncharacterized SAM-dependent methyltransferase